ncbi:hypothetical protein HNY73_002792 [Argiope bruennichi]|uniref:Uncharacterized protein n=1 Tax=Argiope bruennichi TaxID=94029 RepID=A0A8T0FUV8_ARGBR|nr:hypothetical protein HNY73_002792 [Argiope bruennichi]
MMTNTKCDNSVLLDAIPSLAFCFNFAPVCFGERGVGPEPRQAAPGLRLSLPSCFSECNIDEFMAYTETPNLEEVSRFRG